LKRWWALSRGKEDPYAKIGTSNDRTQKKGSDYVWALKNIDFSVNEGEVLGIVGRNGAGKSTLLKLLSKVTAPTKGNIKVKGRIASLLEVGTGFHPELTGRENIFLNGAILGMTKSEIKGKFDEIVDFSGVEKYVDTPVKRFSSGMYVRLAFAVSAFLEPEILIIDEVLAVGDIEFQRKCLGRMKDVSENDGRTVLFVSHNMGSVLQLCTRCLMMENGQLKLDGKPSTIVEEYFKSNASISSFIGSEESEKSMFFKKVETVDTNGFHTNAFSHSSPIKLRITIGINRFESTHNIGLILLTRDKRKVFTLNKSISDLLGDAKPGEYKFDFIIPGNLIAPSDYSFIVALNTRTGLVTYDWIEDVCPFRVYDDGTDYAFAEGMDYGCIILKEEWEVF
jgi:lipopolysaccharide transport system ATP-binding protein